MEIEILEKKENPLLNRVEVYFAVHHPKTPTPKRNDVKDALANVLNTRKDLVVIDSMEPTFGKPTTFGYAKIYSSVEVARSIEPEHIQRRNNIYVEKKKEEGE